MKKLYFVLVLALCFSFNSYGQSNLAKGEKMEQKELTGPVMSFESTVVDYGKIAQHSEPLRSVKFTNVGTEPLVIKNARGSCGCTVPDWPKQPIMPGETSKIEVRYSTNRLGAINRKITITTNEGGEPHVLSVVGNVHKSEESEGVPKAPGTIIKKSKSNN